MPVNKSRGLRTLIACSLAMSLSACENPIDCIIDDRPVLDTSNLSQPVLNQVYDSTITVSIKNNPNDNDYRYSWTLVGELPPGINYGTNRRELAFFGAATSLGDYPFRISLHVGNEPGWESRGAADASNLCRQNVTRHYSLNVAPL